MCDHSLYLCRFSPVSVRSLTSLPVVNQTESHQDPLSSSNRLARSRANALDQTNEEIGNIIIIGTLRRYCDQARFPASLIDTNFRIGLQSGTAIQTMRDASSWHSRSCGRRLFARDLLDRSDSARLSRAIRSNAHVTQFLTLFSRQQIHPKGLMTLSGTLNVTRNKAPADSRPQDKLCGRAKNAQYA